MIKLDNIIENNKGVNPPMPTELITAVSTDIQKFNWFELVSYAAGIVQALTNESLTHAEKKQKATELIKRYYITLPYQPIPVYLLDLLVPALIEQVYRWVVK
jgi:hypothetical protein